MTILGGDVGRLFLLTVRVKKKKSTLKLIQHIQFPAFSISVLISI